jgi:hypothetical protein
MFAGFQQHSIYRLPGRLDKHLPGLLDSRRQVHLCIHHLSKPYIPVSSHNQMMVPIAHEPFDFEELQERKKERM